MRLRSTGLGKTELIGKITGVEKLDDLLIVHVQTKKPVVWHVRTGFQQKDKDNAKEPENF